MSPILQALSSTFKQYPKLESTTPLHDSTPIDRLRKTMLGEITLNTLYGISRNVFPTSYLHALNSTGMSQVLVHKSPWVLTKDGVTSAIPVRRISNDAKDGNSMKSVRIHVVNFPLFWLSGRGRAKIYSQIFAVYRTALNPLQPASSQHSKPIFASSHYLRRHPESHTELSPAKQGQKAV